MIRRPPGALLRALPALLGCAAAAALALGGCLGAVGQPEGWVELRTPHFRVVTDAGPASARRVAEAFEAFRAAFGAALPAARLDSGMPLTVVALAGEATYRDLVPPVREGGEIPPGFFLGAPERGYVVLRLESGEAAYRLVCHEYTHHLIRQNFSRLPLWLDEGLAELYGATSFGRRKVRLGRPVAGHLARLGDLSPGGLEDLLVADRTSPLYRDPQLAPAFYARSWLLVHYLVLGEGGGRRALLYRYLARRDAGAGSLEAAREAFGDLGTLAEGLTRYAGQEAFYTLPVPAPERDESGLESRDLPRAEALALRGAVLAAQGRTGDAETLLREALGLDPTLAVAHEGLGIVALREGHRGDALARFRRAAALPSAGPLALYYTAALTVEAAPTSSAHLGEARDHLRRALAAAPGFVSARGALAGVLAALGDAPDEAVRLAREAAVQEPGELRYRVLLGEVLLRAGRLGEAREVARRVAGEARSEPERAQAEALLRRVEKAGP